MKTAGHRWRRELNPAQSSFEDRRRAFSNAGAVGDQQLLGRPRPQHAVPRRPRRLAAEEGHPQIAWRAAFFADDTDHSHNPAFQAGRRGGVEAEDQVSKDRRPRRPMEKDDFLQGKRAPKHDLINHGSPRRVRDVPELVRLELQIRSVLRETGGRKQFRLGPALVPLLEEEVVEPVGRDDVPRRPERCNFLSKLGREHGGGPHPQPVVAVVVVWRELRDRHSGREGELEEVHLGSVGEPEGRPESLEEHHDSLDLVAPVDGVFVSSYLTIQRTL
mmetsp:Transcript_24061/g.63614  ORF Transcript_24061/g.63614 Transcript_24061/m.63614 type:complete len:274 (-) Transcript_24061:270-1091(-)